MQIKITENSIAGRALCAISDWALNRGHDRICAAMAWVVCRCGEQPLIGDDWNDEDAKEAELRAILSR